MQQAPNDPHPSDLHHGEWERGLWWMVLVSVGIHLAVIAAIVLTPNSLFLSQPRKVVSYTVDLVAPDRIGGTNLVEGGKGRVNAPPLVAAAPKKEAAKPPPPPEPEKPKEVAAVQPPPAPVPAKKEEPDKDAFSEKQKPVEISPPTPTPAPKVEPKPTGPSKAEIAAAAKKAAEEAKAKRADEEAAKKAAEEAALKKAAEAAAKKAEAEAAAKEAAAKARDDQILAAVKRRAAEQSGERGGGTGSSPGADPGGPISVGPGEGAGGQPFGLDYVLYLGQLERRIKESWAWAGTDATLEAVVRFSITPTGDIVDVRIIKSSPDRGFDASVERAVRGISPMPPPPEQYRDQFGDVEYTFNAQSLQK